MTPGENSQRSTFCSRCKTILALPAIIPRLIKIQPQLYKQACPLVFHLFFSFFFCGLHRYKQAAFCYEELILFQPTVPLYHLAYAEASNSLPYPSLLINILQVFKRSPASSCFVEKR